MMYYHLRKNGRLQKGNGIDNEQWADEQSKKLRLVVSAYGTHKVLFGKAMYIEGTNTLELDPVTAVCIKNGKTDTVILFLCCKKTLLHFNPITWKKWKRRASLFHNRYKRKNARA